MFSPGDRVVCVDTSDLDPRLAAKLQVGAEYEIEHVDSPSHVEIVGSGALWLASRFKLAGAAPTPGVAFRLVPERVEFSPDGGKTWLPVPSAGSLR